MELVTLSTGLTLSMYHIHIFATSKYNKFDIVQVIHCSRDIGVPGLLHRGRGKKVWFNNLESYVTGVLENFLELVT